MTAARWGIRRIQIPSHIPVVRQGSVRGPTKADFLAMDALFGSLFVAQDVTDYCQVSEDHGIDRSPRSSRHDSDFFRMLQNSLLPGVDKTFIRSRPAYRVGMLSALFEGRYWVCSLSIIHLPITTVLKIIPLYCTSSVVPSITTRRLLASIVCPSWITGPRGGIELVFPSHASHAVSLQRTLFFRQRGRCN